MNDPTEQASPTTDVAPAPASAAAPWRHGTVHTLRYLRPHLLGLRLVLTALFVLAVLYTLAITQTLIVPLVLAMFLGLGLNPLVAAATRIHMPRAVTAVVVMLALLIGLVAAINALTPEASAWLKKAPSVVHQLRPKLAPFTHKISEASKATQSLVDQTSPARRPAMVATPDTTFNMWDVLAVTPKVFAFTLTVILLVFFFLIYGDKLLLKLVEVSPSFASKRDVVRIVRSIQSQISRYIFTVACINFCLGAVTAGILYLLGMPDPLLWGGVAALANFMPYVGAVSVTLLLAVVGLVHFPDAAFAMLPALCFACLSAVEGNVITPMIMGRHMRLSPVAILLWLIVWAWLWGIAGALLAVPMLTSLKLIAEHVRGWHWFALMVSR
ncbi:MAG: AI-2E family transporter [Xanthomonadales bacterium]|nr:AI-2E family transporter [Xanthomonadales bacterium]